MALKVPSLVFLAPSDHERLKAKAFQSGRSRSEIVASAIAFATIEKPAPSSSPDQFAGMNEQLFKISVLQAQSRELTSFTLELLRCYMQYQLARTASEPTFDEDAISIGKERFGRLLECLERRLSEPGVKAASKPLQ